MKCFRLALREQYVNRIRYGLLPLQKYKLDLSVEDVFGGKTNRSISFTTDSAPRFFLDFNNFQKIYTLLRRAYDAHLCHGKLPECPSYYL